MRVLRLEGANGESIYRDWMPEPRGNETLWSVACGNDVGSDNHPTPHMDDRLHDNIIRSPYFVPDLHFGFSNSDQYLAWVFNPTWRKKFHDMGVVLRVYEVSDDHGFIGGYQVAFVMKEAELVAEHSPMVYDGYEEIEKVA